MKQRVPSLLLHKLGPLKFAVLGLALLCPGCSEDGPAPTAPAPDGFTLVTSKTICAEGGTLQGGGFTLTIPPGALGDSAHLVLYVSTEESPLGDHALSDTYLLEGLLSDHAQPLQIGIDYQGSLSEESFIAVGREVFVPCLGESETIYDFLSAVDSSGNLRCELPLPDNDRPGTGTASSGATSIGHTNEIDNTNDTAGWTFAAVKDFRTREADEGRFRITYPAACELHADGVINTLVMAQQACEDLGFMDLSAPCRTTQVILHPSLTIRETVAFPSESSFPLSDPQSVIAIDATLLDDPYLPQQIGSALFQLSSNTCSPSDLDLGTGLENLWLHVATASWSETLFSQDSISSPTGFLNHATAPFNPAGIQPHDVGLDESIDHGQGMSSLVGYLVDRAPDSTGLVLRICADIRASAPAIHLQALIDNIEDPAEVWWPAFLGEYVAGGIYSVPASMFLDIASGIWEIRSNADTLVTFSDSQVGPYPDLSAKLFRIKLGLLGMDETAALRILAKSTDTDSRQIGILLFGFDGSNLLYLTQSPGEVDLLNIAELSGHFSELVVVVAHSSCEELGCSDAGHIDLEITYFPTSLGYDAVEVRFKCGGHFWTSSGTEFDKIIDHEWEDMPGVSLGNTFMGTWERRLGNILTTRTVELALDENWLNVVYISITESDQVLSGYYARDIRISVSAEDIPLIAKWSTIMNFTLRGSSVCDHTSFLEYRFDSLNTGGWHEMTSFDCDSTARLSIMFDT